MVCNDKEKNTKSFINNILLEIIMFKTIIFHGMNILLISLSKRIQINGKKLISPVAEQKKKKLNKTIFFFRLIAEKNT